MGLLRAFTQDEHQPHFSTLRVIDAGEFFTSSTVDSTGVGGPSDVLGTGDIDLFEEYVLEATVGTVGSAGRGWVNAAARTTLCSVRLELHDGEPAELAGRWTSIVETPVIFDTGQIGLGYVAGGSAEPELDIGGRGSFRVRIASTEPNVVSDEQRWLLQFWSVARPAPPRWLRRSAPAVPDFPAVSSLDLHGGQPVLDAVRSLGQRGAVTMADLERYLPPAPDGQLWLDSSLIPTLPGLLTTGHDDLDGLARANNERLAAHLEQEAVARAAFADSLGVPTPLTLRGFLPLLRAAGLIEVDENGGYRAGDPAPPLADLSRVQPPQTSDLDRHEHREKYAGLASDLTFWALWAGPAAVSREVLAGALLCSRDEIDDVLKAGQQFGMVRVEEDGELVGLDVVPRPEYQPDTPVDSLTVPGYVDDEVYRSTLAMFESVANPATGADAFGFSGKAQIDPDGLSWTDQAGPFRLGISSFAVEEASPALPISHPPVAGIIDDTGDLIVWRDGSPVPIASFAAGATDRAVSSRHGVVVLGVDGADLVDPHGQRHRLSGGMCSGSLDGDGSRLVLTRSERSRYVHYLVDLETGSSRRLHMGDRGVIALDGARMLLTDGEWPLEEVLEWTQRRTPPVGTRVNASQFDPISGSTLAEDPTGLTVIRPDGRSYHLRVVTSARMAPGGRQVFDFRFGPAAITLFEVETGAVSKVCWLPDEAEVSDAVPWRPIWEDMHHMLVMCRGSWPSCEALRVDVRSGDLSVLRLPPNCEHGLFVEPLITGRSAQLG